MKNKSLDYCKLRCVKHSLTTRNVLTVDIHNQIYDVWRHTAMIDNKVRKPVKLFKENLKNVKADNEKQIGYHTSVCVCVCESSWEQKFT